MEDISAGPASPTGSAVDFGHVPEEKREETVAGGESGEEGTEGNAEGGGGEDGDHPGALGIVALPGACCVCIEMEQIISCLHSEKICILPILACLLSLALCTAGLKWVFVDKIFEYEPPMHLDPKPIGQDPFIISVDPTVGPNISTPHSTPSTVPLSTAIAVSPGRPEVTVGQKTTGPDVPQSPSVTLKYNADRSTVPKQTPSSRTTVELNDIFIPTPSATSTAITKTSSHVTRCSDSQKNYCVNGGECFTLEVMPGSTKFLCRCSAGFTGHRCEQTVLKRVINPKQAEELYQKRILTITGICIALLVVGIMCVVAYCKTKKQRKKLHDRLRRSMRKKRSNATSSAREPSHMPLQDLQLVNQCNGMTLQHASEKEPETSFSTIKPALTVHETATLNHTPSQRYVSAVTTPPATPGSPPSEMSAPLSSLAISVPSVALSPSAEEERPLLLATTHQPHKASCREEQKRVSAHYNHGQAAHSLPPSPLFTVENNDYRLTSDSDTTAAIQTLNDYRANPSPDVEFSGDSMLESETEEAQGEHTPFLMTDSTADLLFRAADSSRTTPASLDDDLQLRSSIATKQEQAVV